MLQFYNAKGMGKVRGASIQGGNLRGVGLLVSNSHEPRSLPIFCCLPLDAWNVASDKLEWMQLQNRCIRPVASDVDL